MLHTEPPAITDLEFSNSSAVPVGVVTPRGSSFSIYARDDRYFIFFYAPSDEYKQDLLDDRYWSYLDLLAAQAILYEMWDK